MGRFVENALRPGSREFVLILNCVLLALFAVMLTVVYTELEDSYHVYVLLFLLMGLAGSINWFILETNNLKYNPAISSSAKTTETAAADRPKTD